MRGITFSIEAVTAVFVIIALSSFFVFSNNPPNHLTDYKVVAMDIANLAVNFDYWSNPLIQNEKIDYWSKMIGLCITMKKEANLIQSDNCGEISKTHIITAERIYFDQSVGQMSVFTVGISPPG